MGIKAINSAKTVTTAGTRVQVSSSANYVTSIYFEALGTNTGYIYVGDSLVSSTVHIARLSAGQGFTIAVDVTTGVGVGAELNLSDYWIDSSVSGEKCQVTYLQRTGSY